MKVVFLFESGIVSEHNLEQYGITYYVQLGYSVEIWSLFFLYNKLDFNNTYINKIGFDIKYINTLNEFENAVLHIKNKNTIFVIFYYHGYNSISYYIRKIISKNDMTFINYTESDSVYQYSDKLIIIFFIKLLKDIYRIIKSFLLIFLLKKNKIMPLKICLQRIIGPIIYKSKYNIITTQSMLMGCPSILELFSKRNIVTHSEVYDEYLNAKNNKDCNYIVFIDQPLMNITDNNISNNLGQIIERDEYYINLIKLFDIVKKDNDCDIFIAAHPKSIYCGNEFGKYRIIKNNTNCLIKNSKVVIIMFSTCLGQVILNNKPMLSVGFSNLNKFRSIKNIYKNYNRILKCKTLNLTIDNVNDYKKYMLYYDKNIYSTFINKYIINKNGIQNVTNIKILEECLKNQ